MTPGGRRPQRRLEPQRNGRKVEALLVSGSLEWEALAWLHGCSFHHSSLGPVEVKLFLGDLSKHLLGMMQDLKNGLVKALADGFGKTVGECLVIEKHDHRVLAGYSGEVRLLPGILDVREGFEGQRAVRVIIDCQNRADNG